MKRRGFLSRLLGSAGAIAAAPLVPWEKGICWDPREAFENPCIPAAEHLERIREEMRLEIVRIVLGDIRTVQDLEAYTGLQLEGPSDA